jgi:hypothetical protein
MIYAPDVTLIEPNISKAGARRTVCADFCWPPMYVQ